MLAFLLMLRVLLCYGALEIVSVIIIIIIAYSMGQTINSVCVHQCVFPSLCLTTLSRWHFLTDFCQKWHRGNNSNKKASIRWQDSQWAKRRLVMQWRTAAALWGEVCAMQVLPMRVGPFAFRYQGNGATPCQYIDTTWKATDCATTLPLTVFVCSLESPYKTSYSP